MAPMETQVEELADNRVRLQVEVGSDDVRHAVEHAASDLAESMKIPGFRKGRVPMPVLLARVGRERLYAEAVESHIGGWFRAAAVSSRIRPVEQPEFGYDPPASADESFRFTATVAVQPKPELPDWSELEVPYLEPEVPEELVERELDALAVFRQEAVRALAAAATVEASTPLVEARTRALLQGLALSLERRGVSLDTYLQVTGGSADELVERLRNEARESVAGELVLEAAADKLAVQVSDEEL